MSVYPILERYGILCAAVVARETQYCKAFLAALMSADPANLHWPEDCVMWPEYRISVRIIKKRKIYDSS